MRYPITLLNSEVYVFIHLLLPASGLYLLFYIFRQYMFIQDKYFIRNMNFIEGCLSSLV
jgi:hypothetical protein